MSKEREDRLDPNQPTLIVKCGNAKRKHRPIDRDVLVLGRAAGCDVGLDAPDVAPVHCVIVRAADGWRVRDCTGKGATRLNGESVGDAVLDDDDVLQIGSFSFALHLPPDHRPLAAAEPVSDNSVLRHARRSRRRFAELALRLRERLAEITAEKADDPLAERQEELDRQAEALQALQHDLDSRFDQLKRTAQEVAARNAAVEERRRQADAAYPGLEIRARELGCYAAYLRRLRQRLNEHEESLTGRWEEWLREQQEASLAQAHQSEKTVREEATLREQRAEVVRLMGEMRQLRSKPDPRAEALRAENEQLRRDLAEREAAAAAARQEADELRARLNAEEVGALQRFVVELDAGRRTLDEQIREVQGRFADLEQVAREAESRIADERARIAAERQELERLRGGLWPGEGRSPGAETLVDVPSPLRHFPELTPASAPSEARA